MRFSGSSPANAAVVSRPTVRSGDPNQYLLILPDGASSWTPDPEAATVFTCMKEAMRAAIRLPGAMRAFALPLAAKFTKAMEGK